MVDCDKGDEEDGGGDVKPDTWFLKDPNFYTTNYQTTSQIQA